MMESLDKDEGYISPLDAFETGVIENNCRNNTKLTAKLVPLVSWSNIKKPSRRENEDHRETLPPSFLTDNAENSAKMIDNLWLILPECKTFQIESAGSSSNNDFPEGQPFITTDSDGSIMTKSVNVPTYLCLSEFIRDAIDLLCGKQSSTFPMSKGNVFSKNPSILVHGLTPSTISNYCQPFLRIASLIVELNHIEECFHFHTSVVSSRSVVCVRFVKFIKDYLKVYQTIIMLKRSSISSLTLLRRFSQPYQQQIQTLWSIVQKQVFASPVLMLKSLNSFMLKIEIPCVSELLQNLLVSCASAYSKYVSDWIFRGWLGSPLEFHIIKNRTVISKDRRFWTHQFTQNEDIPKFLKKLKQDMFNTGRAIHLLKELQRTSNLPTYFDYDTDLYVKFELTHEGIIDLLNIHEKNLANFLTQNAYLEEEIRQAVQAVQIVSTQGKQTEAMHSRSVERNEEECKLRLDVARQKKFLLLEEKKKSQMVDVLEGIKAARLLRLNQAMDELFEEKRREAYREEKELQGLQKGYDLLKQFYGDFPDNVTKTIDSKGEGPSTVIVVPPAAPKCIEIHSAGDYCVEEVDERIKDICAITGVTSKLETIRTVATATPTTGTSQQSVPDSPSEESDSSSVEISNQDTAPLQSEKLHTKDFKTKPIMPFKLDLEMLSRPIVPSVVSNSENSTELLSFGGEECEEFLTSRFLSLSVEIPLMIQHRMANLTLLHHIVVSKQLFRHVKAFQDYLLLQNGLFGYFINTMLIDRVKKGLLKHQDEIPNQIAALNHMLEEVLAMVADSDEIAFLKSMRFDVVHEVSGTGPEKDKSFASGRSSASSTIARSSTLPEKSKKQALTTEFDVLNSLCLHYTVEWPLNIIFTNEYIRQYQLAFSLQMRLFRAEILLAGAAVTLKSKTSRSPQLLQLNSYRYIMLHFVQSVRSYINVTVVHTSWSELLVSFSKMDSLEKIYELLVHHIKSVTSNCLLGPRAHAVMKLLVNQLVVIEAFCCKLETVMSTVNWDKGERIQSVDYKQLVQAYMVFMEIQKVFVQATFTVVQKGYYLKVGHFLDLFNFNKFYDLR